MLSPYAATKRCNETYAEAWSHAYAMRLRGLRYFNVLGPRQDPRVPYAAVIPRWLMQLSAGQRPTIYGDGQTSRDFCPVASGVQANLLAATATVGEARVFNVALGRRTTLNELFRALRDGLAERGVPCSDIEPIYADFRPGDVRHSLADIGRARRVLDYEPIVDFEAGLAETMKWFLSGLRTQTSR